MIPILTPFLASGAENLLYLYLKGGQVAAINLESQPTITFDNGSLSVANHTFNISEISKYTFESPSGITNPQYQSVIVFTEDNTVILPSECEDSDISIHGINGVSYPFSLIRNGNKVSADLSVLPAGVYIFTYKGNSYKFRKL